MNYATVRWIKEIELSLGPQVAYVVSWLNEAQMKPRCTPWLSDASRVSIRAAQSTLLSLPRVGGLGLGSIPAGTRFPSSAPRLQAPRSHSSKGGMSCQAGSDGTHHPPTVSPIPDLNRANDSQPRVINRLIHFRQFHTVVIIMLLTSIFTQQNKNSWWEDASLWGALPMAGGNTFLLVELLKTFLRFDKTTTRQIRSRLFRRSSCWLAGCTFSLVTRNCFGDFIGWKAEPYTCRYRLCCCFSFRRDVIATAILVRAKLRIRLHEGRFVSVLPKQTNHNIFLRTVNEYSVCFLCYKCQSYFYNKKLILC